MGLHSRHLNCTLCLCRSKSVNRVRLLALPILAAMVDTSCFRTAVNGVERIWNAPYREEDILAYVRKATPHPIECQALEPLGELFTVMTASLTS